MTKLEKMKALFPEDLYEYSANLTEGELDVLTELNASLEKHLRPVLVDYIEKGRFPRAEFDQVMSEVGIYTDERLYEEFPEGDKKYLPSQHYQSFLIYTLARFDTSIATFTAVHAGLGYLTFLRGGSEEQVERFVPKLRSFEWQTCFALTEPDHGSDIAGGLEATAKREGDKWIINGEKRWIGGAGTADVIPVYARDIQDGKIKCFVVKKGQEGLRVDIIENKMSLRMVENGHIYLENVEVDETDRLQNINGFKDVASILYGTRAMVANLATGNAAGAYLSALEYTSKREQFGRQTSGFQLIQEKLSTMLIELNAMLGYTNQLATLQAQGGFSEVRSSMAKMYTAKASRHVVALAREVCGGNGIVLDHGVGRHFIDAEAIYTYEGTHEINALVIGRAITGQGAFV